MSNIEEPKPDENVIDVAKPFKIDVQVDSAADDKVQRDISKTSIATVKSFPLGAPGSTPSQLILSVLYLIVFFDVIGGTMMMVAAPLIFRGLPDATQEQLDGGMGVYQNFAKDVGFSTTMNLGQSLFLGGSGVAGICSSYLARVVGRKGALQVFMIGGCIAFVLNGFAKNWSVYAYFALRLAAGLFGGCAPVVQQYIYSMYDDSDVAAKKAAGVGGILAIAVAVGPLLGKACIGDRKQHLFMPFYVAAGLQAFGFLLVTFVIPRASGQSAGAHATKSVAAILVSQTIVALVPASVRDKWLGYQNGVQQAATAVAPFVLVQFLDSENGPLDYNPAGCSREGAEVPSGCPMCPPIKNTCVFPAGTFLYANAAFALATVLPYFVLRFRLPRVEATTEDEEQVAAMKTYEESGDFTWLDSKRVQEINLKRMSDGLPQLKSSFGCFQDDKPHLERIHRMARTDFKFYAQSIDESCFKWENGSQQERDHIVKSIKNSIEHAQWTPEAEQEFSKWFVDYLKWAGYSNPARNPRVMKGVIMMHFPFILENGPLNEGYLNNPTIAWKTVNRWIRASLRLDEETLKPLEGTVSRFSIALLRPTGLS